MKSIAALLQGKPLRVVFDIMLEQRLCPDTYIILVGIGQLTILIVCIIDDGLQFLRLLAECIANILKFAPTEFDAQIAIMYVDVFLHIEEKMAVTRLV